MSEQAFWIQNHPVLSWAPGKLVQDLDDGESIEVRCDELFVPESVTRTFKIKKKDAVEVDNSALEGH